MTKQPPITAAWLDEWDAKRARSNALKRADKKRTRERKKLIGQCAKCHRQAISGMTRCHIHRESDRILTLKRSYEVRQDVDYRHAESAYSNNKKREWKSAGLCRYCGRCKPEPGIFSCKRCKDRRVVTDQRRYQRRKSVGVCPFCNRPPVPGMIRCAWHREDKRLRDRKNSLLAKERKNDEKEG